MSHLSGLKIALNMNGWWLFLLFLLAVLFSIFVYRRTNPPVSKGLKRFLTACRIVSLLLLIFLLFKPVLTLNWIRRQKPQVAVLIDNSASLQLSDASGDRARQVQRVLANPFFEKMSRQYDLFYATFSDKFSALEKNGPDSLLFDGDGTNINLALSECNDHFLNQHLRGIVLISDGQSNLGHNPLRFDESLRTAVFPIGVGSAEPAPDVVVSRIMTNQVTYVNNKLPVDIVLQNDGFARQQLPLVIRRSGKEIARKIVRLNASGLEQTVRLFLTPESPGVTKYEVEIPVLDGELTARNNRKSFFVNVLKNRLQILLVAGSPSADVAFFKKCMAENENFELTALVEKKQGNFYQRQLPTPAELQKYDCVVFLDYPRRDSNTAFFNRLLQAVTTDERSLLLWAGPATDFQRLRSLKGILPLQLPQRTRKEKRIQVRLTPEGEIHPVFRLKQMNGSNQAAWQELPPVFTAFENAVPNPWATVAVEVDKAKSGLPLSLPVLPLVAFSQVGTAKTVEILAYELWRWDFQSKGFAPENSIYPDFMNMTLRWLVAPADLRKVRVEAEKLVYRGGEPIRFSGEVYFGDFEPLDNADIRVHVSGDSIAQELRLVNAGDGKYDGELSFLPDGDYVFHAEAVYDNHSVGADSGRFAVEAFNLEFLNTRLNETLLQQLAFRTNGHYFTSNDTDSLGYYLDFPEEKIAESREIELWNKLIFLVVMLVLLATEWYIRKKKGML